MAVLAFDVFAEEFRCRRTADGWVFEVSITTWPLHHEPATRWQRFRTWKTAPTAARIARTIAAMQRRYFRTCAHCGQRTNVGEMHDDKVCMGCAFEVYGVVY